MSRLSIRTLRPGGKSNMVKTMKRDSRGIIKAILNYKTTYESTVVQRKRATLILGGSNQYESSQSSAVTFCFRFKRNYRMIVLSSL